MPDELRADPPHRTVPSFAFPEAAARALARVAEHADWRARAEGEEPELAGIDVGAARQLLDRCLAETRPDEGVWLDTNDAASLLECFGIRFIESRLIADGDAAVRAADEIGYPVVLKAGSPELVHKSDAGGVVLGLADADAVRAGYDRMAAQLGTRMGGAVVQRTAVSGVETIVGVTQDPSFGPLVLFGLGGVTAELLADRTLAVVPITDEDARRIVRSLRGSPLFFGYRGRPAVDVAAVEDLLLRVGRLADALPEVSEMDLNPVIVSPAGAIAIDVKVHCRRAPARMPPDFRRMRE